MHYEINHRFEATSYGSQLSLSIPLDAGSKLVWPVEDTETASVDPTIKDIEIQFSGPDAEVYTVDQIASYIDYTNDAKTGQLVHSLSQQAIQAFN